MPSKMQSPQKLATVEAPKAHKQDLQDHRLNQARACRDPVLFTYYSSNMHACRGVSNVKGARNSSKAA